MRKILRSLSSKWSQKVTSIEESRDLNVYTMNELIGNLTAYEVQLNESLSHNKLKMKKEISFKINLDSDISTNSDEDLILLTRKFKKAWKARKQQRNKNDKPSMSKSLNDKNSSSRKYVCYNCKKLGHLSLDCPMRKNEK